MSPVAVPETAYVGFLILLIAKVKDLGLPPMPGTEPPRGSFTSGLIFPTPVSPEPGVAPKLSFTGPVKLVLHGERDGDPQVLFSDAPVARSVAVSVICGPADEVTLKGNWFEEMVPFQTVT